VSRPLYCSGAERPPDIGASGLSHDFPGVVATLAEELREPAFPVEELDKLKQRLIAAVQHNQEDTRHRATEMLSRMVYAKESPFYQPTAEELRRAESVVKGAKGPEMTTPEEIYARAAKTVYKSVVNIDTTQKVRVTPGFLDDDWMMGGPRYREASSEGSGAALSVSVLRAALACHLGMATFDEAGVDERG
jgi:hypothetical protein